jgi:hypothetical protein
VGFLKRPAAGTTSTGVVDPVTRALDQLRRAGADPTVPHPTRHFIYVPGVHSAHQLARALKNPQRHVEIDTSARQGYWLVVVRQSMVVTPAAMTTVRDEIDAAAARFGGHYDRWQVDFQGG